MGNIFTQPHNNNTSIDQQMIQSIQNGFPGAEIKREVLADYYVSAPLLHFYEKDMSGNMVKTSDTVKYGEALTGSLNQPIFVDLGMNAYLPLNDVKTGEILLQTNKPMVHKMKNKNTKRKTQKKMQKK